MIKMLKSIRVENGLSIKDVAEIMHVTPRAARGRELADEVSSNIITEYIEYLDLSYEQQKRLEEMRRDNWKYDEGKLPMSNELERIRNGLGVSSRELSNILLANNQYWTQIEYRGAGLTDDQLDLLSKRFVLSSATIRRLSIINERVSNDRPIPDSFKVDNPEIQDPIDLYDNQHIQVEPGTYLSLIREIEDENGGSVSNASEEDPKLIRLRNLLGVIYTDDEGGE